MINSCALNYIKVRKTFDVGKTKVANIFLINTVIINKVNQEKTCLIFQLDFCQCFWF